MHLYLVTMPEDYVTTVSAPSAEEAVRIRRREMEEAMHQRELIAASSLSPRQARRVSRQVDERHAKTFMLRAEHSITCPCTGVSTLGPEDLYD